MQLPGFSPAGAAGWASRLKALHTFVAPPTHDPELAHAQISVLARQIPLLFVILIANAVVLAATHLRSAPPFLTLVVPAILCTAGFLRLRYWRRLDLASFGGAGALARMKTLLISVAAFGAVFVTWALALYPYGDAYARCHVAFYISITVISCILSLTHLRGAALLLTVIVAIPFSAFFLHTGNLVLIAMVINFVLVAGGLIIIMLRNYDDFLARITMQRETQRLSDENFRLAHLDGLTLLPNRRSFLAELDSVLAAAGQTGAHFAVAIIDLDRFKAVNDTYGHAAGDRLLERVGERLAKITSQDLFISRLGGDEFGVILKSPPDETAIHAFGARVKHVLEPSFTLGADGFATIGCSIGVATYPENGQTAEDLFERADYALYEGKQHDKGHLVLFSQELETRIRRSSQIEHALRNANLERELSLEFQPIIDATTGRTGALESLARWHSPTLGRVSPSVFIPIAEHCQLINQITKILFVKLIEAAQHIPFPIRIGFNLSAQDLCSRETMAQLQAMLRESGMPFERITFEITESALLQDFDLAAEMADSLQQSGAYIALDDFGVGFSSLAYVHRLKPKRIKIDKTFVTGIETGSPAAGIIRSIVDLCRHLGLECIAEGVETEAELTVLRELGPRFLQGYYFAKPMPLSAIPEFLTAEIIRLPPALPIPAQRRHTMLTL